ncbi:hypothetical protein, partial [Mesorhizobium sp.]|uniref:hypothetical protein n=1 Tax=Mesorhizobium sp. TaxID=1871066 RepID=UPI00120D9D0F
LTAFVQYRSHRGLCRRVTLSRLLIELLPGYAVPLTGLSGTLWVVAFGLFLMAFRRMTDAEASGAALG